MLWLLVLLVIVPGPVAAQPLGDSLAVATTINRYHAALEIGDRTELRRVLAPGAMVLERGEARPFDEATLDGLIRVAQAMNRRSSGIVVRPAGSGAAYGYGTALVEAKSNPDLIRGREVESVVLSRTGQRWFIELIHVSFRSEQ